MSSFTEMPDDVKELNAQLGEDVEETTAGGSGAPEEPAGGAPEAPPAPAPQPPPAAPAAPWQGHPNEELIRHLPAGLKKGIAAGHLTPEQALNQHFGGRRWNTLIQGEQRYQQQIAELNRQNQASAARLEALFRHFGDTLGLGLPPELQPPAPPAPPDPVAQLGQKVDRVLQMEEERRVDAVVDQVDVWSREQIEQARAADPEYDAAHQYVVDRLIETHTSQAAQAAMLFGQTKDQRYLAFFDPEELRLFASGQITEDELVTRAGLAGAMDFAARMQQQLWQEKGDLAGYIMDLARRSGFQGNGAQPVPAAPPERRPPAPARPDPRLEVIRRRGTWGTPAPAGTPSTPTPAAMAEALLAMGTEDFEKMMAELVAAGRDPEEAFTHIMQVVGAVS